MSSFWLDDRFDDEFWYEEPELCAACGEQLEPGDDRYIAIFAQAASRFQFLQN